MPPMEEVDYPTLVAELEAQIGKLVTQVALLNILLKREREKKCQP